MFDIKCPLFSAKSLMKVKQHIEIKAFQKTIMDKENIRTSPGNHHCINSIVNKVFHLSILGISST
jgi:hypothetical protein